jgi:SAM-dependent methyltransferase
VVDPASPRHPASFRDPSGFLFKQDGQLYRQVNLVYQADYDHLVSSGLYQRLTEKNLLIPHKETTLKTLSPGITYKVIQPDRIPFITYPYEWSFSQLKDAALCTLAIQRQALKAGMVLKDASAYNIQFYNGTPILIDTLSFAIYQPGQPWIAYRQFCQHFLAPLALMCYTDVRLVKLLQIHLDGLPLDLTSRLLPKRTRLNFGLLTHLHAHAAAQQRYAGKSTTRSKTQFSPTAMTGLVDSLENSIKKLAWKPGNTAWSDYYDSTNYTADALDIKKRLVSDWLHEVSPQRILDLGANTGLFSRLGAELPNCLVISTDFDPGAVELNYLECKRTKTTNILPLVIDLTNPSPAIGWENQERFSFTQREPVDLVMALALIHHLAISNNLPLDDIAHWVASLAPYLIIEFVPKEDSQVHRLLASRDDIFPGYSLEGFIQAFANNFILRQQTSIPGSQRSLFLFERKS